MQVYLDDERETPAGWQRVYWPDEAIALLKTGAVSEISLDHDLGDDERGTGYDVVLWIEEAVFSQGFKPPVIKVHSANSSAREKMERGIKKINQLNLAQQKEVCPICKGNRLIRSKLSLIDSLWEPMPETDSRLKYFTDLGLDDVIEAHQSGPPLEQFIAGYFCDHCMKGFVSKEIINAKHKFHLGE